MAGRRCTPGGSLEKFPSVVARLAAMVDRFASMLDCVDVGFPPDGILDQLPLASQIGGTRVGGIDLNRPRMRGALDAVLALAVAPDGFTVGCYGTRCDPSPARPKRTTRCAKPPTTYASCVASTSSSSPSGPAASTCPARSHEPSPPYSPCAISSSHRSSPASADPGQDDRRSRRHTRMGTTSNSAPGCEPCSTTSRSARQHRQQIVDQKPQAPRDARGRCPRRRCSSRR
jgi:hypothetical protein